MEGVRSDNKMQYRKNKKEKVMTLGNDGKTIKKDANRFS